MHCAIIGDSLAVGVATAAHECMSQARVGITSAAFLRELAHPVSADLVVISLGANDGRPDYKALVAIRKLITAQRVIWLVPAIPDQMTRGNLRVLAAGFADKIIDLAPITGGKLHATPAGYATVAKMAGVAEDAVPPAYPTSGDAPTVAASARMNSGESSIQTSTSKPMDRE